MAFQRATFGDFQSDPFTLHRVSVFDGDLRVIQRDRADLFALFFCLIQTLGDQAVAVLLNIAISCGIAGCGCALSSGLEAGANLFKQRVHVVLFKIQRRVQLCNLK